MKLILLSLLSFNLFAASVLDEDIYNLGLLNGAQKNKLEQDLCPSAPPPSSCPSKSKLSDEELAQKFFKCADGTMYSKDELAQFLKDDNTDTYPYVAKPQEPSWFVCQHFSTQAFMRGSCFANSEDVETYEEKTPIKINNGLTPLSNKLPIFYLSLGSASNGFYHAINAIFTGSTVEEMKDINNYIFFEPQSDKLYKSVDELRADWTKYNLDTANDLKFKISTMDKPGSTSDGSLQFRTQEVISFDCSY